MASEKSNSGPDIEMANAEDQKIAPTPEVTASTATPPVGGTST